MQVVEWEGDEEPKGFDFGNPSVPKTNLDKNDFFYRKTEYIPEYGERNESH